MYIVFEGIVGSGKSTQSKKLVEYLKAVIAKNEAIQFSRVSEHGLLRTSQGQKQEVLHVREPGSTPIAEDIRHLAQGKEWENEIMHPLTNAYLYAAARAQTLHTVVKPALDSGKIVVSDRSFISSVAYQGVAQGLGMGTVLRINEEAIKNIFPDIIFYMDIDVETSLSRTFDAVGDKWEKMGADFFRSIARGYDKCEKWKPLRDRFIRINARGTPEEVFERIIQKLESKI